LESHQDSWKNRGIVATWNLHKGTIIAMYGGVIFDRREDKHTVTSYSLDMKESGKTLAIDG
jgi:hypothetical protein